MDSEARDEAPPPPAAAAAAAATTVAATSPHVVVMWHPPPTQTQAQPQPQSPSAHHAAAAAAAAEPASYPYQREPSGLPPSYEAAMDIPNVPTPPSAANVATSSSSPSHVAITIAPAAEQRPITPVLHNQWVAAPAPPPPPAPRAAMPAPPAAAPIRNNNGSGPIAAIRRALARPEPIPNYVSSFDHAPAEDVLAMSVATEMRRMPRNTGDGWRAPAWWRNSDGTTFIEKEKIPPQDVVIADRMGAQDIGGTHYYHCFDRCMTPMMLHSVLCCDRHPWHTSNVCVPYRDPDELHCCWCYTSNATNPGTCPSPWHCCLILAGLPCRLGLLVWLHIPLLIATLITDILLYFWTVFWFCDGLKGHSHGDDGDTGCSWSFGRIDHRYPGQRFKYPHPRRCYCCGLGGFLKIWCCMITNRQRHYSICPACIPHPSDNEYLALRLPDRGRPLHVSTLSRWCANSCPCHPYSHWCAPSFATMSYP